MRAKLALDVDSLIVTGVNSGRRYQFTRTQRVLSIADEDVEQFRTREVLRSSCGCSGGHRQRQAVKVFKILSEEEL